MPTARPCSPPSSRCSRRISGASARMTCSPRWNASARRYWPRTDGGVVLRIPSRRVLADDVYEQIRGLIMSDGIAPGARVNIDEIARQLDVSPTPVREALARLESEELVSRLPLRGYRVTDLLNRKQVDDLYA